MTTPFRPTFSKWNGSGKTYAGRVKTAPIMPRSANAIASVDGDPAERRAAQQVRLDEEDVRRRSDADAEHEPDGEREQEAAEAEARLAHRPRARGDEERREDAERDEVAEREVDDPGQPVDQRVADGEDPVHAPGREAGDDHLDDEAHGGTLLR